MSNNIFDSSQLNLNQSLKNKTPITSTLNIQEETFSLPETYDNINWEIPFGIIENDNGFRNQLSAEFVAQSIGGYEDVSSYKDIVTLAGDKVRAVLGKFSFLNDDTGKVEYYHLPYTGSVERNVLADVDVKQKSVVIDGLSIKEESVIKITPNIDAFPGNNEQEKIGNWNNLVEDSEEIGQNIRRVEGFIYTEYSFYDDLVYSNNEFDLDSNARVFYNYYNERYEKDLKRTGLSEDKLLNLYGLLGAQQTDSEVDIDYHNTGLGELNVNSGSLNIRNEYDYTYNNQYLESWSSIAINNEDIEQFNKYKNIFFDNSYQNSDEYTDITNKDILFPFGCDITFETNPDASNVSVLNSAGFSQGYARYISNPSTGTEGYYEYTRGQEREGEYVSRETWDFEDWLDIFLSEGQVVSDTTLDISDESVIFSNNIDDSSAGLEEALEKVSAFSSFVEYGKDNFRTYHELLKNKKAEQELVLYELQKMPVGSDEPVQRVFFPNDVSTEEIRYFDSQVKFGQQYEYRLYSYRIVMGNQYQYKNFERAQDNSNAIFYEVVNELKPEIVKIEEKTFQTVDVKDAPPAPPNVQFNAYESATDVLLSFTPGLGRGERTTGFIEPENAYLKDTADVVYRSDDNIQRYSIYRVRQQPRQYSDFSGNKVADVDTSGYNTASFKDQLEYNTEYYYTFTARDIHDQNSPPSPVYKLILLRESGDAFVHVEYVGLLGTDSDDVPQRDMKRFVQVDPAVEQLLLDQDLFEEYEGALQAPDELRVGQVTDRVWGKKFKLRLTSKHTGQSIDINFKLTYNVNKSMLQISEGLNNISDKIKVSEAQQDIADFNPTKLNTDNGLGIFGDDE